jgi:hypothetical protein
MAVCDAASRQIVRREFQRHAVAVHDFDAIAAESSGHGREHRFARVQFDGKHSSLEFLDNFPEYFD